MGWFGWRDTPFGLRCLPGDPGECMILASNGRGDRGWRQGWDGVIWGVPRICS